jgi:hypothetical protein
MSKSEKKGREVVVSPSLVAAGVEVLKATLAMMADGAPPQIKAEVFAANVAALGVLYRIGIAKLTTAGLADEASFKAWVDSMSAVEVMQNTKAPDPTQAPGVA